MSFSRNTIENVFSLPIRFFCVSVFTTAVFYYGATWYYKGQGASVDNPFEFIAQLAMLNSIFLVFLVIAAILVVNAIVLFIVVRQETIGQRLYRLLRAFGYVLGMLICWTIIQMSASAQDTSEQAQAPSVVGQ